MRVRLMKGAVLAMAVLAATGCGHTARPAGTTKAQRAAAARQVKITEVKATECAAFRAADRRVTRGTARDRTVGELSATLNAGDGKLDDWIRKSTETANLAGYATDVPKGPNAASAITAVLVRVGADASYTQLDAGTGDWHALTTDWNTLLRALEAATASCRGY